MMKRVSESILHFPAVVLIHRSMGFKTSLLQLIYLCVLETGPIFEQLRAPGHTRQLPARYLLEE